jgi:hypothetical protein
MSVETCLFDHVIPAKAGILLCRGMPAFAGMTTGLVFPGTSKQEMRAKAVYLKGEEFKPVGW